MYALCLPSPQITGYLNLEQSGLESYHKSDPANSGRKNDKLFMRAFINKKGAAEILTASPFSTIDDSAIHLSWMGTN